jgi:hypothetical protein
MFEWISFNQFNNIKAINNDSFSAIWGDGPLTYNNYNINKYTRTQNKMVTMKYLNYSQNITKKFLNEV